MRKVIPGYRLFACDDCDHRWEETSRDAQTLSHSKCLVCREMAAPYKYVLHSEWITCIDGHRWSKICVTGSGDVYHCVACGENV